MESCQIEVDSNNMYVIKRLLYYLSANKHTTNTKTYVMECRISVRDKPDFLLYPKDPIEFIYEDHTISIVYHKTKESTNYHSKEVRFDLLVLKSEAGYDHLKKFLCMIDEIIIPEYEETEICKYIWTGDSWVYNKVIKPRDLSTIYFHDKTRVVTAIDKFLNDTYTLNKYKRLNIPYKKIFMFHGLPGSGKSSFIRALASQFQYNMSFVKNSAKLDDISLERMMQSIRNNSFIIFEDIDTLVQQRETKNSNVSFGGILNMLDGINNVHKLLIFITTNHIHTLDMAFKRRVDMFIEFGYIRKDEIIEMYQNFFEETYEDAFNFYTTIKHKKFTANALEKFFIDCMNHEIHPTKNLKFLDEYSGMTSDSKLIDQLYS